LGYLDAGVKILEKYLFSPDIYWSMGVAPPRGEPPYPSLTLGGLLLAQARLRSPALGPDLQWAREQLDRELEMMQRRWRTAWENKATREFHARLFLWRDYLEEYRSNPSNHKDRYSYEVGRRVMLQLLEPYAVAVPAAERDMLHGLDELLRAVFVPGDFIWEAHLEAVFPSQPYWYLYGQPRGEGR
jgi:hypothetical protein